MESSSLTRDQTQAPCIGNTQSYPLDHQGSPRAACSIPLIYMSVFVPVPHCFDYYSFVVWSEVWMGYSSSFVVLPQDYLVILGLLWFHINFRNLCSSSVKNVITYFDRGSLNLWIASGIMAILTILILLIQEHGISSHFFESFSVSFISGF